MIEVDAAAREPGLRRRDVRLGLLERRVGEVLLGRSHGLSIQQGPRPPGVATGLIAGRLGVRERGGPLVALGPVGRGLEAEQHVAPANLAAFLEHSLEHDARHARPDLGDPRGSEAPRQVVHAGDGTGRRHEHGRHLGGRRIGGRGRGLGRRVAAAADGEEDQQRLTPLECGSENQKHGKIFERVRAHGRIRLSEPHVPDELKI